MARPAAQIIEDPAPLNPDSAFPYRVSPVPWRELAQGGYQLFAVQASGVGAPPLVSESAARWE